LSRLRAGALVERLVAWISAYEAMDYDDKMEEGLWLAYESTRALLGDPIKMYPGGWEDEHYHPFAWQPADGCEVCEEYQDDLAATMRARQDALPRTEPDPGGPDAGVRPEEQPTVRPLADPVPSSSDSDLGGAIRRARERGRRGRER
jgi:hypothetical protein